MEKADCPTEVLRCAILQLPLAVPLVILLLCLLKKHTESIRCYVLQTFKDPFEVCDSNAIS